MFAVSYRVGIGSWSVVLPFPTYLDWLFGFFRSSGRFMWPVAYALIGIVLTKFYRTLLLTIQGKTLVAILLPFFLIQQADISVPLLRQEREVLVTNSISDFKSDGFEFALRTLEPYTSIRAYPQGDFLDNHYAELNYLAWKLAISTDLHFTSRINMAALYRRESETFSELCSSSLTPLIAYAVTNESLDDLAACKMDLTPIFTDQFHTFFGTTS
jgi:hypothetical protein